MKRPRRRATEPSPTAPLKRCLLLLLFAALAEAVAEALAEAVAEGAAKKRATRDPQVWCTLQVASIHLAAGQPLLVMETFADTSPQSPPAVLPRGSFIAQSTCGDGDDIWHELHSAQKWPLVAAGNGPHFKTEVPWAIPTKASSIVLLTNAPSIDYSIARLENQQLWNAHARILIKLAPSTPKGSEAAGGGHGAQKSKRSAPNSGRQRTQRTAGLRRTPRRAPAHRAESKAGDRASGGQWVVDGEGEDTRRGVKADDWRGISENREQTDMKEEMEYVDNQPTRETKEETTDDIVELLKEPKRNQNTKGLSSRNFIEINTNSYKSKERVKLNIKHVKNYITKSREDVSKQIQYILKKMRLPRKQLEISTQEENKQKLKAITKTNKLIGIEKYSLLFTKYESNLDIQSRKQMREDPNIKTNMARNETPKSDKTQLETSKIHTGLTMEEGAETTNLADSEDATDVYDKIRYTKKEKGLFSIAPETVASLQASQTASASKRRSIDSRLVLGLRDSPLKSRQRARRETNLESNGVDSPSGSGDAAEQDLLLKDTTQKSEIPDPEDERVISRCRRCKQTINAFDVFIRNNQEISSNNYPILKHKMSLTFKSKFSETFIKYPTRIYSKKDYQKMKIIRNKINLLNKSIKLTAIKKKFSSEFLKKRRHFYSILNDISQPASLLPHQEMETNISKKMWKKIVKYKISHMFLGGKEKMVLKQLIPKEAKVMLATKHNMLKTDKINVEFSPGNEVFAKLGKPKKLKYNFCATSPVKKTTLNTQNCSKIERLTSADNARETGDSYRKKLNRRKRNTRDRMVTESDDSYEIEAKAILERVWTRLRAGRSTVLMPSGDVFSWQPLAGAASGEECDAGVRRLFRARCPALITDCRSSNNGSQINESETKTNKNGSIVAFDGVLRLFPEVPLDLKGCSLRVATFHWPPFVMWPSEGAPEEIDGLEIRMARGVASGAGFRIAWVAAPASNWSALAGAAANEGPGAPCELALAAAPPHLDRNPLTDALFPRMRLQFAWFVPMREQFPRWQATLRVFAFVFWSLLALSFLLQVVTLWLLARQQSLHRRDNTILRYPQASVRHLDANRGLWWAILASGLPLLGCGTTSPRSTLARAVWAVWLLYALQINTAFQSGLTGVLADPGLMPAPTDLASLLASSLRLEFTFRTENALRDLGAGSPYTEVLRRRVQCAGADFDLCLRRVATHKKSAFLTVRAYGLYTAARNFSLPSGVTRLRALQEEAFATWARILVRRGSPLLVRMDRIMERLEQGGFLGLWWNQIQLDAALSNLRRTSSASTGAAPLRLTHMQPAFLILGIGLGIAGIAGIMEIVVAFAKNRLRSRAFKFTVEQQRPTQGLTNIRQRFCN